MTVKFDIRLSCTRRDTKGAILTTRVYPLETLEIFRVLDGMESLLKGEALTTLEHVALNRFLRTLKLSIDPNTKEATNAKEKAFA